MHGMNYQGLLCGVDPGVEDKPYVFYCGSKDLQSNGLPREIDFRASACVQSCPVDTKVSIECLRPALPRFSDVAKNYTENGIYYYHTFRLDVLQTAEMAKSYASYAHSYYCVPQDYGLGQSVLYGAIAQHNYFAQFSASLMKAWPVLLLSAFTAGLLGWTLLYSLRYWGGLAIAVTLSAASIFLFLLSAFLSIAIFFPGSTGVDVAATGYDWGTLNYVALNPIVRTIWGWNGKLLSLSLGLILGWLGFVLVKATQNILPEVDRQIGMIWAAMECIFCAVDGVPSSQREFPIAMFSIAITKSLTILVTMLVLAVGLALLTSIGYVDNTNIIVSDTQIAGMSAAFKWYRFQYFAIAFYVVMALWIIEVTIASYQFDATFAVSTWYLEPVKEKVSVPGERIKLGSYVEHMKASLQGLDAGAAQRDAIKFKEENNSKKQFVIVPAGPGGRNKEQMAKGKPTEVVMGDAKFEVKTWKKHKLIACTASWQGFRYHLGTLATAAVWLPLYRLPSFFCLLFWAALPKGEAYTLTDDDESLQDTFADLVKLLTSLFDARYGKYNPRLFTSVVLHSTNFEDAASQALSDINEAGGVVHLFHGCCEVYQFVGVVLITMIATIVNDILLANDWLTLGPVQDSWSMTILSAAINSIVAYTFVGLFGITVDTILSTFVWARNMKIADHRDRCPESLMDLVDGEIDAAPILKLSEDLMSQYAHKKRTKNAINTLTKTVMATKAETSWLLADTDGA